MGLRTNVSWQTRLSGLRTKPDGREGALAPLLFMHVWSKLSQKPKVNWVHSHVLNLITNETYVKCLERVSFPVQHSVRSALANEYELNKRLIIRRT